MAQDLPPSTAADQMGQQAFQSYHGGNIDQIGLANGTLSLNHEFLSYSQRGALHLSFNLFYTNQPQHFALWCIEDPTPTNPNQQKCSDSWGYSNSLSPLPTEKGDVFVGWAQETALTSVDVDVTTNAGKSDQHTDHYANWSLQTADGAKHPLGNLGSLTWQATPSDSYSTQTGPFETLDATQWRVNGSLTTLGSNTNTLIAPDGVVGGTQDPNGNVIAATAAGFTDTVGRQIPLPPTYKSASNTDTSGCPQPPQVLLPVASAVLWNVPAPNGVNAPYKFCYATVPLNIPSLGSIGPFTAAQSPTKLQSIVLPDGHTWNFEYNDPNDGSAVNYGTLTKITLPTGGTIAYTYATTSADHLTCQNGGRWVTSRTVDANDGAGPQKWTYGYQITDGTNSTTLTATVTDPLGNYVVHTFSSLYAGDNCPAYESETQYFQNGGALLKTVSTHYSFIVGSNSTGPINVVPNTITTTWPSGKTETVTHGYDIGFNYIGYKGGTPINAFYGEVTSEAQSDYGQGAAGPTVRTISTTYKAFSDPNYLAANMLDLVSSKSISDGSGCKQAETDYSYDDPGYLTTYPDPLPSGTHGGPPNIVRGNLTTTTEQLFPANSCPTTAQSGLTSHTNWYDTGEVHQSIDPMGHTTTHNYDSALGGAYPTETCSPSTTNGTSTVAHCVSGTYDLNSGLLTSFTDQNATTQASGNTPGDAAHTSFFSYDNLWRMTVAKSPADNQGQNPETDFLYPDLVTVIRKRKLDQTGAVIQDDAAFDGLGRTKQTTLHDPAGDDLVDTTYDTLGRVSSVSNPHRGGTSSTDGITTTYYDALGRVVQVAPQDGTMLPSGTSPTSCQPNNICTDYSNFPTVIATDQAGHQRRSRTDALGRLVEVEEPGSPTSGTAAQGSLTVNGALLGEVTVSISGADRSITAPDAPSPCPSSGCPKIYDSGSSCININAVPYCAGYDQGVNATAAAMAGAISSVINSGSGNAYVTATASVANVILTARSGVSLGSVSISFSAGSDDTADFPTGSYHGTVAAPVYDSGTVSASANGFTGAAVPYSSTGNASATQVAAALAATLNVSGSPVTAQASGAALIINYKSPGAAGNAGVSVTSASGNPALFPQGSFNGNTTLSGGQDPDPTGMTHPFPTYYSYDALGNLLQVNQLGDGSQPARVRTFTYDSLGRLLTAQNPETGKITYTYDNDGNLLTKTAPAPNQTGTATVTTTFRYDALHRLTYESFSDGTYRGGFTYDEVGTTQFGNPVANGIGRLTSSWEAWGGQGFSYDALGRTTLVRRVVEHPADFLYSYNLDGSVKSLQYPSGRVVNYGYNTAGHALSATDSNGTRYVSNATYWPNGAEFQRFMPNIYFSTSLNKRLQVSAFYSDNGAVSNYYLNKTYNYGALNNGNILSIVNNKDTTRTQTFAYDNLNRLTSAQNAGTDCSEVLPDGHTKYWGNSYGYDPWGNLINKTITKCGAEHLEAQALQNNQISGYGYDAAGNMTNDLTSGMQYHYDAGNMLKTVGSITYWYDNDGRRYIKWNNGVPVKSYFYGAGGEILAEGSGGSTLTAEYIFFNGKRLARVDLPGNAVHYYLSDALNSTSMEVSSAGVIENESDYYPWGGELKFTASDPANPYKFTGKERDTETGLDYFGARYYSNGLGRFITPDWAAKATAVPYAEYADPQSLNLYSYVRNIPTTRYDLDGHCAEAITCGFEIGAVGGTALEPGGGTAVGAVGGAIVGVVVDVGLGGYWIYQHYFKKAAPGSRPGKDFTRSGKRDIDNANANKNGGKNKCEKCGKDVKKQPNKKGEPTPDDQLQRHHKVPKSQGGSGTPENGEVVCPPCHQDIHNPTPAPQPEPQPQPQPAPQPEPAPAPRPPEIK